MADLDPEEQALLEKHRAKKSEQRKADDERETWIRAADGSEATVPYHKAKTFLAKTFGIDLDDEPTQDPAEGGGKDDKDDAGEGGGQVRRFGRRVS